MTDKPATVQRVAFLGTGLMGAPMARRLLGAGFEVSIWNRDPAKAAPLASDGALVAGCPAEAVEGADVVFTMLSNGQAVTEVLFGRQVAERLQKGALVIDCSSIPPALAREHADKLRKLGAHHIDAPVSGGVVGAEDGGLAIMAGGDAEVIARAAAVFAPLGRVTHVGPDGAGQVCKLANQQLVAVTIGALAEAMVLVAAAGASREAFRHAVRGGFAESRILELHGERMVKRRFKPGGPSKLQLKDLDAVLSLATSLELTLPLTAGVHSEFRDFVDSGGGDADHSALLVHLEKKNQQGHDEERLTQDDQ